MSNATIEALTNIIRNGSYLDVTSGRTAKAIANALASGEVPLPDTVPKFWCGRREDCRHDKYWTTHHGNCMACMRDEAETEAEKLRDELQELKASRAVFPASTDKPFFYAVADSEGRAIMDEICCAEHPQELCDTFWEQIDNLTAKVVPVYSGPQIEKMREEIAALKAKVAR